MRCGMQVVKNDYVGTLPNTPAVIKGVNIEDLLANRLNAKITDADLQELVSGCLSNENENIHSMVSNLGCKGNSQAMRARYPVAWSIAIPRKSLSSRLEATLRLNTCIGLETSSYMKLQLHRYDGKRAHDAKRQQRRDIKVKRKLHKRVAADSCFVPYDLHTKLQSAGVRDRIPALLHQQATKLLKKVEDKQQVRAAAEAQLQQASGASATAAAEKELAKCTRAEKTAQNKLDAKMAEVDKACQLELYKGKGRADKTTQLVSAPKRKGRAGPSVGSKRAAEPEVAPHQPRVTRARRKL